ncbi:MAG: pentapeptide repeat-containing protein [Heteroscytonema crispum UTEX LB 1556]
MAQNFCRANLRGKSFKGQDLTGADFSDSDIRGADFTQAKLRGANFSHVKAGMQRRWSIGLLIYSLLLSATSGLMSAIGGALLAFILVSKIPVHFWIGVVNLTIVALFLLVTIRQGMLVAFGFLAVAVVAAGTVAVATAGAGAVAWISTVATAGTVVAAGVVAVVVAAVGAVATAGAVTVAWAIAGFIAVIFSIILAIAGTAAVALVAINTAVVGTVAPVAVVAIVTLVSIYLGWRAIAGDQKQVLIRDMAFAFVAKYGTSFRGADLTDADFTQAKVKNTDFAKANLTRTCWYQVQNLQFAAVGKSYLKDVKVRQLVVTKNLQNKNCNGWNLQGINLQGANLMDANLIAANLGESNLQNADLSRARLLQTQLDKTDFRGATLTGAYIEDWGITPDTKLDGVKCEYIFMHLPTPDNPNPRRQPCNWIETFKEGEFTDFIGLEQKHKISP